MGPDSPMWARSDAGSDPTQVLRKDAPKRKNIMKYLKENATMEAIDPSKLSKADMAGLQGASQVPPPSLFPLLPVKA
eukprot:3360188-Rhodomonas_salina.2